MANEIIVNAHSLERRIAVIEDNRLVELLVEKRKKENIAGNIYKGIVRDVLPGMGAAFVDIGLSRTGFLHYTDIVTDYIDRLESDKHKLSHIERDSSKINKFIKSGDEVIVQAQKGPIGKKGARLTGHISIPGKFLVLFPNGSKIAVSKKIPEAKERDRIKKLLMEIKTDKQGLIVRTAAEGNTEDDFKHEYKSIHNAWKLVEKQINHVKAPSCIFDENDLLNVLVRDLFHDNIDRVVVDNKEAAAELRAKVKLAAPELLSKIELYTEDSPIFDAYGIEKEIENTFKSRINLVSGGNIVIEQTEALVSIDINTGSFTGNKNYDETVKRTNVEAASEIARQIRLRDLSGIMVVDFIDMKSDKHRQLVLETLKKAFKRDRAKNKVYPFGPLGLVEITRKRTRTNLLLTYSEHCPHCNGTGRVLARDSVGIQIYRWLKRAEYFIEGVELKITVHPRVKAYLQNHTHFFKMVSNVITLEESAQLGQSQFRVVNVKTGKEITNKYNA